jgi:transcriptional regulator with XRE-family HTH domain
VNLRALRTAAGLSVRELAARAGIANGYVPMMEAAKLRALPRAAVLDRLARALGTTVRELRGRRR